MRPFTRTSVFAASLLASAALAFPGAAIAQADAMPTLQQAIGNPDNFKLSGSMRLRYEALDGQPRAGFRDSEDLASIRTTIAAEYRTGQVRIGAELFDSRVLGFDPGGVVGTNEVNTLELVQAYVAVDLPDMLGKGSKTVVRAGRMTMNFGSRRFVTANEYRNTINAFTGVRGDTVLASGVQISAFYVLPQTRLPEDVAALRRGKVQMDRENFDTQLWGALVAKPGLIGRSMGEVSYVGLAEKDAAGRATRDRRLHSLAARFIADPASGQWDYEVEGAYQFGTISATTSANAASMDVSAWFIHADLGYTFPGSLGLRVAVDYDRASGDGPGGNFGRFDTLYGMRRIDFAPPSILAAIGRANINSPGVRVEKIPGKQKVDGLLSYRPMWADNRFDSFSTSGVRDATGRSGIFAGHLVYGRVRWLLVPKFLRAEINAAYIAKARLLTDAPNAPKTGNTRFISAALTATF